jgi:hypothetical protein
MDFFDIIVTITLSLVFILLVHTLFEFFKEKFTKQKTYDLVNKPNEKYENMFKTINSAPQKEPDTTNISDIKETPSNMKDELKNFLKDMNNKKSDIKPLAQIPDSNYKSF